MTKVPKMTKAHFEYIAGMLAEVRPNYSHSAEYDQWEQTVKALAIAFTWTNDNFDRVKFAERAGV